MQRNTIDLKFADGEYTFALPIPRLEELQRKTGIGIGGLFSRLLKGVEQVNVGGIPELGVMSYDLSKAEFYALDVVETIRQGLIGGASGVVNGSEVTVTPAIADTLLKSYVLECPLYQGWSVAVAILAGCIMGYDPPKKDQPVPGAGSPPKRKSAAKKKAGSTTASS